MFKSKVISFKKYTPWFTLIVLLIAVSLLCGIAVHSFGDELYIGAAETKDEMVIIDAGHGGEDCGAIGVNGVYEKDLNLAIAFLIGKQLEENGITVVYTRTEDKMLYKPEENIKGIRKISDLRNRCEIASRYPDAIFVSIHMNSFGQEKYSGAQVYTSVVNSDSRRLAEGIQSQIRKSIQPDKTRCVKEGKDIYVLKNLSNRAVLIECGFLSNKAECDRLSQKEYQKQLSFSIVCAIIEYIGK